MNNISALYNSHHWFCATIKGSGLVGGMVFGKENLIPNTGGGGAFELSNVAIQGSKYREIADQCTAMMFKMGWLHFGIYQIFLPKPFTFAAKYMGPPRILPGR